MVVMWNQAWGRVLMSKWKGREAGDRSRHREKQRKGDPEAHEKQGKLGIPAPQIHPEWPKEPSLPISVSGSCLVKSLYPDSKPQ